MAPNAAIRSSVMVPSGGHHSSILVGKSSSSSSSSSSGGSRRVSFYEGFTTEVIEIPDVDPAMKPLLFYNKKDYTAFYMEKRQTVVDELHAMVRDVMSDQIEEARANGATEEDIDAMIPKTPEEIYKVLGPGNKKQEDTLPPAPALLEDDDDDDSDSSESDGDSSSSESADDDEGYDWGETEDDQNDGPSPRRRSMDSDDLVGYCDYDWDDDDDDTSKEGDTPSRRRRSINSDDLPGSIDSDGAFVTDDDGGDDDIENSYVWEETEKPPKKGGTENEGEASQQSFSSPRRQRSVDLADSDNDFSDDAIYALFGVLDGGGDDDDRTTKKKKKDEVSSPRKTRDSLNDSNNDLTDDAIYALFGLRGGGGCEDSPTRDVTRFSLSSPSKRGYRRAVNMYIPAPKEERMKRRSSRRPRRTSQKSGGKKRCDSFAKLLSRTSKPAKLSE